jgi:nitrogen fixation protein NifU and related proteins
VYSTELLEHFQNPRNTGQIESPDSAARLENPVCGDVLELTLRLENRKLESRRLESRELGTGKLENKRIAEIRFRAKGCVPTMACASAITELAKGKTVHKAREITRQQLLQKIGGVPDASSHAAQLALDTLAALLRNL